jgi:DNA modification methylase
MIFRSESLTSNVWSYPGINSFGKDRMEALGQHPTVKPIALIADALKDCTSRGDLVLDPFGGSGSNLARGGERWSPSYLLECEPHYVYVCIRRWQNVTKRDASRSWNGTFSDICQLRNVQPSDACPMKRRRPINPDARILPSK